MKEVNSCCCFSLRTGGLIIGWLNFLSFLAVPLCIAWLSGGIPQAFVKQGYTEAYVIQLLVLSLLYGFAGILLLIGIYKEREVFIKAWLIFGAVVWVLSAIRDIVLVIRILSVDVDVAVVTLIAAVLVLALYFYIWWAIYSLRKKIICNKRPTELAYVPKI